MLERGISQNVQNIDENCGKEQISKWRGSVKELGMNLKKRSYLGKHEMNLDSGTKE